MFGFIKNFFSGIAAFFGGLFSGKKSQDGTSTAPKTKKEKGYYMKLDETGNVKTADQEKKPEPVQAGVATVEPPTAEPTEAKKPEPEPAKAQAVPSKEKVKIEAQPNPPAPANPTAPAANNGKVDPQSETTFAPHYLISTASQSRRRPGPSMDLFRDMARQVKTRS